MKGKREDFTGERVGMIGCWRFVIWGRRVAYSFQVIWEQLFWKWNSCLLLWLNIMWLRGFVWVQGGSKITIHHYRSLHCHRYSHRGSHNHLHRHNHHRKSLLGCQHLQPLVWIDVWYSILQSLLERQHCPFLLQLGMRQLVSCSHTNQWCNKSFSKHRTILPNNVLILLVLSFGFFPSSIHHGRINICRRKCVRLIEQWDHT